MKKELLTLVVLLCVLFGVMPARQVFAQADGGPTYRLDNVTLLYEEPGPEMWPWSPAWSPDGTKFAFLRVPNPGATGVDPCCTQELVVLDLRDLGNPVSLVEEGLPQARETLTWTPDGSALLHNSTGPDLTVVSRCSVIPPYEDTHGIITRHDIDPSLSSSGCRGGQVVITEAGPRMSLALAQHTAPGSLWPQNVYLLAVDESGTPDFSTVVKVIDSTNPSVTGALGNDASMSPSGDDLLFTVIPPPEALEERDIYLLTGLLDIWEGIAPPVTSLDDPRVFPVETGSDFAFWPAWSQDGSLCFYCENFTGVLPCEPDCDFGIAIASRDDVIAGSPSPQRLSGSGYESQIGGMTASPGGTRLAFGEAGDPHVPGQPWRVYAAALRISDVLQTDGAGLVQDDFYINDAAGTQLHISAGTTVDLEGVPVGNTAELSVYTPISPVAEALLEDVDGIPVVRDFDPDGLNFTPSATLTVHYTDAEIAGLDEDTLTLVKIEGSSIQIQEVIERNTVQNYLVAEVSGFSRFGIAGLLLPQDTDGDGLLDEYETRDLDPDTPDVQNPFDPDDPDSTGDDFSDGPDGVPDGRNDYDGDGMSNREEFTFGTDPTDPDSWVELPLFPIVSCSLVTLLLLIAAVARTRGRGVAPVEETP